MPAYALVKDGEQIGYVDTETGEAEYNGDDSFERGMIEGMNNKYLGSPGDGTTGSVYLKGEKMEEVLQKCVESDETDFEIVKK